MEHTGWYPDYQMRLFKNGQGHYPCKTVHELIEISGEIGTLKKDLLHHHYNSMSQFLVRLDKYTTNDVQYLLKKVKKLFGLMPLNFLPTSFSAGFSMGGV